MMHNVQPTVALIYDFDGTLSPLNMQEYGFIQAIGKNPDEFWARNTRLAESNDASHVLCYMYLMIQAARTHGISLRRESFRDFGSRVRLFDGVEQWFSLINDYGRRCGLDIKHYIISSGLKEMIEGTPIAHEFDGIYACSYLYDVDGVAYWPAVAVDYTAKTQFLFKINKGIRSVSDDRCINEFVPENERPVPFERMLYFGDGATDIPCMKMVKEHGGHSIAVYGSAERLSIANRLVAENRANYACPADYGRDANLYQVVCLILDKIKTDWALSQMLHQG